MANGSRPARRRVDQDESSRPLVERVFIGLVVVLAFVGMVGGAWWLLTQTGLGADIRDTSPAWTPTGDVMFASETDGRTQVVVTNRSGGGRQPLVSSPGNDSAAAFSRDGTLLAFQTDRDGNAEIYVGPSNGVGARNITNNPAIDQMPAWSPDGKKIVFVSNRDNKDFDLYWMNADGGGVERLTATGSNLFPAYAPDGGQIAFQNGPDTVILTLSTRALRPLTHAPDDGTHPSWAPNGQEMAFASTRRGRSEIFIMSLIDRKVPTKLLVTMPAGDVIEPRYSPSGQHVAFVHMPDGLANSRGKKSQSVVYVVEVETGRVQRVSK